MKKSTLFVAYAAVLLMLFTTVAGAWDIYGQVRIYNGTCNTGIGMNGVKVRLHNTSLNTNDSTYTYTDNAFMQAHNLTSPMGIYYFHNVPYDLNYTVEVVLPLGVTCTVNPLEGPWWNANPRAVGSNPYRCFLMDLNGTNFGPHTIGYWKHQATVAVTGQGQAQVPADTLQAYLNLVYTLFNNTPYFPISGVTMYNNLPMTPQTMLNTFNLPNNIMMNKAKKQLLALVLNIAAQYCYSWQIISVDNRTVSQAISFGADMINTNGPQLSTAHSVMDHINNGITVPAFWIPGSYGNVYYGLGEATLETPIVSIPESPLLLSNYPNPFNPSTMISFQVQQAVNVSLKVYDIQGRLVATLLDGMSQPGLHLVNFDGSNLASGMYIYTLQAGSQITSGRMTLVK